MSKIMIIGLDGAAWSALNPLIDEGAMPFFKKLIKGGTHGVLQSVIPPVTAPAWSSFMTGKSPDNHGVFEFRCFDVEKKADYITNASYIRDETIWQILSRHGKKIISVNVPYTYPVYDVNGILISGMDTPSSHSRYCSPDRIKEIINNKFPEYVPAVKAWDMKEVSNENKAIGYIKELGKFIDMRTELFLYLLSENEWDVSMVHFQETDYLQHMLWDKVVEVSRGSKNRPIHAAIRNFFNKIDGSIKRIWQLADHGNSSLFIISDHGFTEHKGLIYPNVALENSGQLVREEPLSLMRKLKKYLRNTDNPLLKMGYEIQKEARNALRFNPSVTAHEKIKQRGMFETIPVIWDKSSAVMVMGSQYAFIYVKDDKHIQPCKDVLEKMIDSETNEPLFDQIITLTDAYGRKKRDVDNMIVAIPREGYSVSRVFRDREFSKDGRFPGIHHPEGIFAAYGNNIRKKLTCDLNLVDIAPTCLYLLGLPVPSDMDGKVIQHIIQENMERLVEETSTGKGQETKAYDEESEKLIKERLRSLGYLE